ncbi:oligosaccharide flippase family protein [Virgibacillus dokdonensis]|uniref:oligosaccharide flippase family protein n=1 Tax=Virgibacillus dokdonensis TaxID=302167 RepID=UPI00098B19E0|nr:oligosaccharide flippase family protein [Virgibacillus dokdonensis]
MEINQRKAGVVLSYTLTIVTALVGFIYIPILIHFLGKDEYGLYQLMGSVLVYLGLFDFGLSNTVTRYYSKYLALNDEEKKENLLAISAVIYATITFFLLIVGVVFYFYLDAIFGNSLTQTELVDAKKMYIIILLTASVTVSTSVFNSIINAHEKFIFLRLVSIIQTVIRPIVVVTVFTIEASALVVVVIQALIVVAGIILKIGYSIKNLKVKIKLHFWDKNLLKEMLRYSFFIFITVVMDQIFWRSDQLILGAILGTTAVSVYSIGSQIVMYYMTLSTSMTSVFLPNITKVVTNRNSDIQLTKIFIRIGRLQYILLGTVLVGFLLFGKEFIYVWVGGGFSESYYITLIILIPFTVDLIQNIGLVILQAKNMYGFRAITFFIMSLLNIVISIPLAIYYGGIGTAFATGVSYLVGNVLVMNIYYYKKVKLDVIKFWSEIFKLSTSFIALFTIGLVIKKINFNSELLTLIIELFIFSIVSVILLWFFSLNQYEKKLFIRPLEFFKK